MSDKKVGRFGGRPITPTEKMESALSDPGTVNMADLPHDKGKASIADKFREREERWRRDQSLHDQSVAHSAESAESQGPEAVTTGEAGETAKEQVEGEGGAR